MKLLQLNSPLLFDVINLIEKLYIIYKILNFVKERILLGTYKSTLSELVVKG